MIASSANLQIIAVLSGDLIHSSRLSADDIRQTRAILTETVSSHAVSLIGEIEFFSGDSWQLALKAPEQSLRLALILQARLKANGKAGTRISLSIGAADDIQPQKISLSTGEAFTLSGRGLAAMSSQFDLDITLTDQTRDTASLARALVRMTSAFANDWTARQAEIISLAITWPDDTHEQLGQRLTPPVRKQTITNALKGANWRAVSEALSAFENTDWSQLCQR